MKSFEKFAQYCPQDADAWLQLGLAHLRTGNAEKASEAFAKCESAGKGDILDECRRRRAVLQ